MLRSKQQFYIIEILRMYLTCAFAYSVYKISYISLTASLNYLLKLIEELEQEELNKKKKLKEGVEKRKISTDITLVNTRGSQFGLQTLASIGAKTLDIVVQTPGEAKKIIGKIVRTLVPLVGTVEKYKSNIETGIQVVSATAGGLSFYFIVGREGITKILIKAIPQLPLDDHQVLISTSRIRLGKNSMNVCNDLKDDIFKELFNKTLKFRSRVENFIDLIIRYESQLEDYQHKNAYYCCIIDLLFAVKVSIKNRSDRNMFIVLIRVLKNLVDNNEITFETYQQIIYQLLLSGIQPHEFGLPFTIPRGGVIEETKIIFFDFNSFLVLSTDSILFNNKFKSLINYQPEIKMYNFNSLPSNVKTLLSKMDKVHISKNVVELITSINPKAIASQIRIINLTYSLKTAYFNSLKINNRNLRIERTKLQFENSIISLLAIFTVLKIVFSIQYQSLFGITNAHKSAFNVNDSKSIHPESQSRVYSTAEQDLNKNQYHDHDFRKIKTPSGCIFVSSNRQVASVENNKKVSNQQSSIQNLISSKKSSHIKKKGPQDCIDYIDAEVIESSIESSQSIINQRRIKTNKIRND